MISWSFLLISVVLHIFIWWVILSNNHDPSPKSQPIDVSIVEKSSSHAKNFARQAEPPPDLLSKEKKKPRFLSERNQSVTKEMQTKNSGLTRNAVNTSEKKPPIKLADLTQTLVQKSPPPSEETSPSDETSKSSESLEKVQEGPMTSLNTERFVYYTFFSRIEERVRPIWERNLGDTQRRFQPAEVRRMINHTFITGIEVLLDEKGNYLGTHLIESCGIQAIDQAAIAAFQEAHSFPNPPTALIKEDGKIHLLFNLRYYIGENIWAKQQTN